MASYNTELTREGPGLLVRDLGRGAKDIEFVLTRMAEVDADLWVLQNFDFDLDGVALSRFAAAAGYAHSFAQAPNGGRQSGVDLDGDGRLGGRDDSQGFGWFSGQGGMAVLSRYPVTLRGDETARLWADIPWATLPETMDAEARAVQRLSSTAHWALRVDFPGGPLTVLTAHATPPVFDGPEDRNGLRNADEIRLVAEMLEATAGPVVIAANLNVDPARGEGRRAVIAELLAHPRLRDPLPGAVTVDFGAESGGRLRVTYVLPTRDLGLSGAGIFRYGSRPEGFTRHDPVWIDIKLPVGE
ncbi:MAG: endonuclease/exonuclease/phosphatase family protein [Pseudomonadota bacterium]